MSIKLIVFDIDETLIYTYTNEENPPIEIQSSLIPVYVGSTKLMVATRPQYQDLLTYCFEKYDVGFWTAASRDYANAVLQAILTTAQLSKIKFVKCYENCAKITMSVTSGTFNGMVFPYKPLQKIWRTKYAHDQGWNRHNTIIIEDTPLSCINNYGNAIYVPQFKPTRDEKLFSIPKLIKYIDWLATNGNIRSIEKRHWMQKID